MTRLPSTRIMYRALLNRDSAFEGVFYAAVRTTGVFCRPTCPARKPKMQNIEYFASPQDALHAGYRPCSRCKPLSADKEAPELVRRLCELVDESPSSKFGDAALRRMGIEPSTARRQFRRYYGMTFQAYHRARRVGTALRQIRNGDSVIGAQIDSGFDSASGFWDAFRQVFGTPPSSAKGVNCLYARWIDTPLGAMVAVAGDDGLYLLEFVDRRGLERQIRGLRTRTRSYILPGENLHLDTIARELRRYFEGKASTFSVPVVLRGTKFEEAVWRSLQTIPAGSTRSYSQLAHAVGNPGAVRAVGSANGRNRLALVVPCHRVIRADGSLCGYGGGVWRKKWLLDHEQRVTGVSPEPSGRSSS
jgi:AraC family transcriptional regulator of adaptative response/methylated-DNA-[protein]-cysteine methyltransferase